MTRITFDFQKFYDAKNNLPEPDGIHCIICGQPLPPRKKKYCSDDCYHNWFRSLKVSWNTVRQQAIDRDKVCQNCGHDGNMYKIDGLSIYNPLEVHHIKPISEGGEEFDLDNLMTLCYDCHKVIHGRGSKKNGQILNRQLSEFF